MRLATSDGSALFAADSTWAITNPWTP
ncbi:hypothetical protein [Actinoplanes derwentensis]|nr:hypothetical protein [Actinoplanes derwentensis]